MTTPKALWLTLLAALSLSGLKATETWPIITRSGDRLLEGSSTFRFFGLATPNIQQHESQIHKDFSNRFPDEFETRDLLSSLHQLGSRATRSFSLSIHSPADGDLPAYISARKTYNEDAFRCLDQVLALCHEYDVRIIIPIIASQSFNGIRGVDEFAALAGKKDTGAFWTDNEVKADFRHLLDQLANRRNSVSGIYYKDDPAILGWQLGNEFDSFAPDRKLDAAFWKPIITTWSSEMAAYLKKIDPNHLVFEAGGDRVALSKDPNIDVLSSHLYEYWNRLSGTSTDLAALARAERQAWRGNKALVIDEFGLGSVENIRALIRTIQEEDISGGLLWSLRAHRRDGSFYYHNEGGTPINSYHFPGFAAGFEYSETQFLDLIKAASHSISGKPIPPTALPSPTPVLLRTKSGFTWRGSTGASHYTIERSASASGPWLPVASGLQDSVLANVKEFEASGTAEPLTLWSDESTASGQTWYYRITALNTAGSSSPSEPIVSSIP